MHIDECIMTNSACYKEAGYTNNMVGIVVHSTGVNNPYVKRYVQPSDDDPNYDEIMEELGTNFYKNDWNHSGARVGVNAFIGYNDKNEVTIWKVMPWDHICWGVASGSKGSFNYDPTAHIQFEMCEDDLKNETYFNACMASAQWLCAELCKMHGWTEEVIVSHKECGQMGYGSMHGDPENWLTKFGKDMNWFRNEVKKIMAGQIVAFNRGDKVGIKEGVMTYANNKTIPAWVKDGRPLWVMASDTETTLITVDETLAVATGRVRTCDLYLCENQGTITVGHEDCVSKKEYQALSNELDKLRSEYDKLSDDYDAVCKERDTMNERNSDLCYKINKVKEILQ